jgi:virulence-associated protein VagC
MAFAAISRADSARIFAPINRPWKADWRDLEPMADDFSAGRRMAQRHQN